MGHQDGEAAVRGGEPGGAARGAVGVLGVALCRPAAPVYVAQGQEAAGADDRRVGGVAMLDPPLAVGHHDRQARPRHPGEEERRALGDLHHHQARLELLRAVAPEPRPGLGARDQVVEEREHLAAVADPQGEGVRAGEEGRKGVPGPWVEEDRAGPATSGPQDVAVGEAAAGHQAAEALQP